METTIGKLAQVETDLGLNVPFIKGQAIAIRNCWHFSTDGTGVDAMYYDERDFREGMNRINTLYKLFSITILAFSLMDTHVHFILYGDFDQCNRFVHEYVRKTSWHISRRYKERHKFMGVPIHHQTIDTDIYLKTAICYVIKNAPVGGLPYNAYDYPWSSAPLYFRTSGYWSSPLWTGCTEFNDFVFPGDYVDYRLVERLFKTHKSFNFFMCISKDRDVEEHGGAISRLSIPLQEMRQHRKEVCKELYDIDSIFKLNTSQRLQIAKILKSRYNSSSKQLARVCGLVYEEVKDII